jgi:hypothetical protein
LELTEITLVLPKVAGSGGCPPPPQAVNKATNNARNHEHG